MKLRDPLTMLGLVTAALAYEPLNDTCQIMSLMQLITSAPADTDTLASFFGTIIGGYFGETLLRTDVDCQYAGTAVNLTEQLSILTDVLISIYGVDYKQRAALLYKFGKGLAK